MKKIRNEAPIDIETLMTEAPDEKGACIEGGFVRLSWGGNYDIKLSRIKTRKDLLKWVIQLGPKRWMTANRMRHFVAVVMDAKGWEQYGLR